MSRNKQSSVVLGSIDGGEVVAAAIAASAALALNVSPAK